MMISRVACVLIAFAIAGARASAQTPGDTIEHGDLRIHFLLRPVGTEHYVVTRSDTVTTVSSDLDFTERGSRVHVTATLDMQRDLTPIRLVASGNSYRVFWLDTRVEASNGRALVHTIADSATVPLTPQYFTIDGYAPLALQMMLVRYWTRHGRPHALETLPGDPTNIVRIEHRGVDTIRAGARAVTLQRYSVDGVVWGHESLWLDNAERLAAITTTAGLLPLEAVRAEYAAALPSLVHRAIADRMTDLARLRRDVRPVASGTVALVGATVIDGNGGTPLDDGTVVVSDGRIADLGPRRLMRIPAGAHVMDVTGMTIIPGLWDSHAHASQMEWGPAYLAAGVTTIRDMGGEFEFLKAFRDAIANGQGLGPRILLAGLIDGSSPLAFGIETADTPEQARAEVRRYRDADFQQIKIYNSVKPDILAILTRAAHAAGMSVTGHIPTGMTVRAAIDSGMDQVAHMPMRVDTASTAGREEIAYYARRHVLVDPTLSWNELLGHSSQEPVSAFQPGVNALPYSIRALIDGIRAAPIDTATAHARVRRQAADTHILFAAGLPIVAGTDKGVPAFSLPRELEIYVSGGFSPMEALRTASVVPARMLGLDTDVGTIDVGRRADLVVLGKNPLDAIQNVRRVRWVMTNGRLYDPADLWRSVGFKPGGGLAEK